jgi:hypothetical protein
MDQGNLVGLVSDYKTADGQTREMADVWFTKHGAGGTTAPAVSELLAPAPDPLPAVTVPAETARSSGESPPLAGLPLAGVTAGNTEEELRQQSPLI